MSVPAGDDLRPEDKLGRQVFSSSQAKNIAKGKTVHSPFMPPNGSDCISVDRLDLESDLEMSRRGREAGKARNQTFYGWAEISVEVANKDGREARVDPIF